MWFSDNFFFNFYSKLSDIFNSSFKLKRKKILKSNVVRRILRSFVEIFRSKFTTIEESQDIESFNG